MIQENNMKKLRLSTLWIIVVLLFLAAIGLIVACAYTDNIWNTITIILLAIDFLALTILVQYVSFRTFNYKPRVKKYPQKKYQTEKNLEEELIALKYLERKREYGKSFLKVENKNAYKVVLIDDVIKYFNQEEDDNIEPNKDLEKCTKFLGIEIFNEIDESSLNKIPDFTIQADKVYYTALIKQDDKYICLNYQEPLDNHKDNFNKVLNDLGLVEILQNEKQD